MAMTTEIWEDSGAVSSGHGTTRIKTNNIGWKLSTGSETATQWDDYPVVRPDDPILFTTSYTKYNYGKVHGSYPLATRPRIVITNGLTSSPPSGYQGTQKTRLYYKLTNTYAAASTTLLDGSYLLPGQSTTLYPTISTTGPSVAGSILNTLTSGTTYYTCYLVTQLYVETGTLTDYGNIGNLVVTFYVDEFQNTSI